MGVVSSARFDFLGFRKLPSTGNPSKPKMKPITAHRRWITKGIYASQTSQPIYPHAEAKRSHLMATVSP
jgi:hypothetical protein